MTQSCTAFRHHWLERALEEGAAQDRAESHAATCQDCRAWHERVSREVFALRSLSAQALPESMDSLLEGQLRTGPAEAIDEERAAFDFAAETIERQEQALQGLPSLDVPSELEERLAAMFAETWTDADSTGEQGTRSWQTLEVHPVPSVLERLLEEELDAPTAFLAKRFVGSLGAVEVPHELGERVDRALRRRSLRRLVTPLVTLAAACLLVWVLVDGRSTSSGPGNGQGNAPGTTASNPPRRILEVRIASLYGSGQEISPLALGFAEALNNGVQFGEPQGGER